MISSPEELKKAALDHASREINEACDRSFQEALGNEDLTAEGGLIECTPIMEEQMKWVKSYLKNHGWKIVKHRHITKGFIFRKQIHYLLIEPTKPK